MLLIPVLLITLLLGHGAQAIYFRTKSSIVSPQKTIQTGLKPEVKAVSKAIPNITPSPSPTISPKPVIPESSTNPEPTTNYQTELLQALNDYRQKNGQNPLSLDSKLQTYAKKRANLYLNIGKIDNHDGFNNLLKNNGFQSLGFMELAENSSFGYNLSAKDLIENIFAKSEIHNKNMLNPIYTHIGIAVSGPATNFIFGGRKI